VGFRGAILSAKRLSRAELGSATAERLRTRREEIQEAVIHRALSVAPPSGTEAPGYVEALRAAIPSAVDYAFGAIEVGEEWVGPTPPPISDQAVASARSKVGLEVVVRRYAAGYSTLSDFLQQELRSLTEGSGSGHAELHRGLTALFDRLVAEVSEIYRREEAKIARSPHQRQIDRIRRLLAGEIVDPVGLDYPMEGSHVAVIVSGTEPEAAAAAMARQLGRRLLIGEASIRGCAIWLGGRREFLHSELEAAAARLPGAVGVDLRLSFGEPGDGLGGWRRSRRQAEAAEMVGRYGREHTVFYRDVALVAAALRDPDLSHHLIETYVEPIGGAHSALAETLLAYLERESNASSAAAALGISRHTVASRLQLVDERLGYPLAACAVQLETALRLAKLGD
jgi:hypothetical protein